MEKLKDALGKRIGEGKKLKLSERLEKAKYLKRTGSPGSYKYIYKEETRSRKGKGNIGAQGLVAGHPQTIAYNTLKKMDRSRLVDILVNAPGSKESREELAKESKPFLARAIVENMPGQVKKYSGKGQALKKKPEKKVEETDEEDYSKWDESELTNELYQSFEDQERINYVAKKLKMPASEVEDDDIQKYLAGMGKKELISEIKKRMR